MATLQIRRRHDFAGICRNMIIVCDGDEIARLRPGKQVEVDVGAGRHAVLAYMDWATSPTVEVDLQPDERVALVTALPWEILRPIRAALRERRDLRSALPDGVVMLRRL